MSLAALLGASALASTGTFTALTYNVAGLPQIISQSDPKRNTPQISPRLNAFDIVNVQENFSFNKDLESKATHAHKTPFSGDVLKGSGLRTFSKFPYIDHEARKWEACYINAADCLTPKGFTAMRVQVSPGIWVDVYNLHSEAGTQKQDFDARRKGHAQLIKYIKEYSAGNAIVLLGDTNTRYTTSEDPAHVLINEAGLQDVWVDKYRSGIPPSFGASQECPFPFPDNKVNLDCEIIDKILFRSGPTIRLSPQEYANNHLAFLDSAGKPLSDHFPLSTRFNWVLSKTLRETGEYVGGDKGYAFNDVSTLPQGFELPKYPKLTSFAIQSGSRIDALIYTRDDNQNFRHGGSGGSVLSTLNLDADEGITLVEACEGQRSTGIRVFYMRVETNKGKRAEGGKRTGSCKTWKAPGKTMAVVGFKGRKGGELDRVQVVWGQVLD